jgi:Domain of unknown function (DUF4185)
MSPLTVNIQSIIAVILSFIHLIHGTPIDRRNTAVPVVKSHKWLGHVRSSSTYVVRDLGFPGQIGDTHLLTFGDTLYRNTKKPHPFLGMVSNSVALATDDPLVVVDKNLGSHGWPEQFVPLHSKWGEDVSDDAIGITNVVPTTAGKAIVFFLKNHRPNGVDNIIGAGVATVVMKNGKPHATRLAKYWWNGSTEPHYGDIASMRSGNYIYAYGNSPSANGYVYVARVHYKKATSLSAYQYWNGKTWQKRRLHNPTGKEALFWKHGQGTLSWNPHLNKFLFIYAGEFTIAIITPRQPLY